MGQARGPICFKRWDGVSYLGGESMINLDKKKTAERWFIEYFTLGNVKVLDERTTDDFVYHSRNGKTRERR